MKTSIVIFPLMAMTMAVAAPAQSPAPTKVGIIQFQAAILNTKDGQKAMGDLQSRFNPKKAELDQKQAEIQKMQAQLRSGSATLSDEAKAKLARDIDTSTKAFNRATEDAQAELDQAEQKIMQELGGRINAVLQKYARDNGYTLILDVSSQQTPVVFASDTIDVTKEVIELYDKNAPGATAPAAAPRTAAPAPAPRPAAPAAARPAAPATKK